ncbi:MAG TPA: hypothetical protein VG826_34475 [Pirellulales bacterium]|nr:hypothetical protein [Pirellulales bacterium]
MKPRVFVCGALALLAAVLVLHADEKQAEKRPASFWMKKKLEYAEKTLEGIAKADFAEIEANAKSMNALSSIEEFVRGRSEAYTHQLKAFDHATKELMRCCEAENLDGATLAYMELTLSCVNCHKHLRNRKESE